MANEEQLSILRQGVEVWNKWMSENYYDQTIKIDLSEARLTYQVLARANLSGANLNKADLQRVNLVDANLSYANLREVDLRKAELNGADLHQADLSDADLRETDFSEADLRGADLRNSNLNDADLRDADLSGADLRRAKLGKANLSEANLNGANLSGADLRDTNLSGADLREANLNKADLREANLKQVDLRQADLIGTDLREADLREADLREADLSYSNLVEANIDDAIISKSNIFGINVWDLKGEFQEQKELIITPWGKSTITVDNIEIAQFIYLILNNQKIRDVLNTLTSKAVLILGRFAIPERMGILNALRNKLREYDLLPVVFDFDRPTDKDFTETIKTLAGISYFVIADVTNPKSSPLELQATVPDYQIPFVPIIQEGERPFAMMIDLQKKYPWVLPTKSYDSIETLMNALKPGIIDPAVEMRNKLRLVKAQEQVTESLRDYVDKSI